MSEKGHAVIVANFETLIAFIISIGALYKPSNPLLQLEALQLMLAEAKNLMERAGVKKTRKKNAASACRQLFARLKPLVTNVINMFEVCGANEREIAHVRHYVRKIYGKRVSPLPEDNPETPDIDESRQTRSVAQTSRSSLIDHLIAYLKAVGFYNPNEEEYQIPTLEAFSAQLKAALNELTIAAVDCSNALADRNAHFYLGKAPLIKRAALAKIYLGTIPELQNRDLNIINRLNFDKPPRL